MRYPLKHLLNYFDPGKALVLLLIFCAVFIIYKCNEREKKEDKKNKLIFKQKLISLVLFFILYIVLIVDKYIIYLEIPFFRKSSESFLNIISIVYSLCVLVFYGVGFLLIKGKNNKTGYVFYALFIVFSFGLITTIVCDFFLDGLYTVRSTNTVLYHYDKGDNFYCHYAGTITQVGNKDLPSVFSKDSILIDYPFEYTYKNKKMNVNYQLIISGVESDYKPGEILDGDCILGKVTKNTILINIRCKDFDPYLVSIADDKPVFKDGWYYFGTVFFSNYKIRVLDYPLAVDKNHIIEFSDCTESFEDFYNRRLPSQDGKLVELPHFNICLKTKLESYPVPVKRSSESEKSLGALIDKLYFSCGDMIESDFDSIPVRFYGGYEFYSLESKYKTGEDIYLYCTAVCMLNDQIVFYVRDYTLESPDEHVEACINKLKK